MPTKQEVLAAIESGELFTPEYQEREKQRKIAVMRERIERQKKQGKFLKDWHEKHKEDRKPFDPYEGKKSGDYVGD